MKVLHRGFDGLDVSFQGQISQQLYRTLDSAKQKAQELQQQVPVEVGGLRMLVSESGARGGYAFIGSTGQFGATWLFKKPNTRDPWGIRVSCNSFGLATKGLGEARSAIYETLEQLGTPVHPGGESISRVDYAIDLLAPEFVLIPGRFVMHSNASRADHIEISDLRTNGSSGRVTSVTVGKMPGRQVIVYDKRAEIIAKHKAGWWEIWDGLLLSSGCPPLNRKASSESRVWRVELRAGKQHLKERWKIVSWADLDNRLGDMISATLDAVRYAEPTTDSNRSRWPEGELWTQVRRETREDLFEMRLFADPDRVKQVQQEEYDRLLARQSFGLLIARAAVAGVAASELVEFASRVGLEMAEEIARSRTWYEKRLGMVTARLAVSR